MDVGVDRECGNAKRLRHHDTGCLVSDAGQIFERGEVFGHLAAVLGDEVLAHRDDVLRLAVREAAGLDVVEHLLRRELRHRVRVRGDFEQRGCDQVDARIGALRREDHGDEQLVRRLVRERRLGQRVMLVEDPMDACGDLGLLHGVSEWRSAAASRSFGSAATAARAAAAASSLRPLLASQRASAM